MRRMERLIRGAVVFCVLYAALPVVTGRGEVFPVFRWDLFASTPQPSRTDGGVRLVALDGRPLTPPVYLEASGLVSGANRAQARQAAQQLRSALRRGDERLPELIARFESSYLGRYDSAEYQLVERRYDIRDRVTCECYLAEEVLAEYSFDRRAAGAGARREDGP